MSGLYILSLLYIWEFGCGYIEWVCLGVMCGSQNIDANSIL